MRWVEGSSGEASVVTGSLGLRAQQEKKLGEHGHKHKHVLPWFEVYVAVSHHTQLRQECAAGTLGCSIHITRETQSKQQDIAVCNSNILLFASTSNGMIFWCETARLNFQPAQRH